MNLFQTTISTGLILVLLGVFLLFFRGHSETLFKGALRSTIATVILMGLGSAWFLLKVTHLGEADLGHYKYWLFVGFFLIAFLSFFTVPDFLSVRGLAILLLLAGDTVLDSAYMQEPIARLLLVSWVYLVIVAAMYLGALPYRMRDFLNWLYLRNWRTIGSGLILLGYGVVLIGASFTY